MCKQDIQIKRKTASNTVSFALVNGSVVAFLKPNPNRVALLVGVSAGTFGGATVYSSIRAGTAIDSPVIGVLCNAQPHVNLRIEDVGLPLTFDIGITTNDASQYTVSVTEIVFNERLEDV